MDKDNRVGIDCGRGRRWARQGRATGENCDSCNREIIIIIIKKNCKTKQKNFPQGKFQAQMSSLVNFTKYLKDYY